MHETVQKAAPEAIERSSNWTRSTVQNKMKDKTQEVMKKDAQKSTNRILRRITKINTRNTK